MTSDPYKGQAVTLLPGRLRGYRQWGLVDLSGENHLVLQSITAKTRWPWTPQVEAKCHASSMFRAKQDPCKPEDVPARDCTCGIYAKHDPRRLPLGSYPVTGVIEAWGPHTEIGEEGFRSRYARISALYIAPLQDVPSAPGQAARVARARASWTKWPEAPSNDAELDVPRNSMEIVRTKLGEIYNVPTFAVLEEMLTAYPPVDISDLLPQESSPPRYCCGDGYLKSAQLRNAVKGYRTHVALPEGRWYVADASAPEPDMKIEGSTFVKPWDNRWWRSICTTREAVMGITSSGEANIFVENEYEQRFLYALSTVTALRSSYDLASQPYVQLGWESHDSQARMVINTVSVSFRGPRHMSLVAHAPVGGGDVFNLYATDTAIPATALRPSP